MRQATIKIRSYAQSYAGSINIVNNSNLERRLLRILISGMILLAAAYIFILGSMVWNIVQRKSLESQAHMLSNEVGELELRYLSLSNKIDLAYGYSKGFKETKAKYAVRKSTESVGSIKLPRHDL